MFDIVTFGSAVVDTFIDTEFNKITKSFNYPAGAKILVHNMKSDTGGGATNTATAFSRFGFKTGCICKIGNDAEGKQILDLFKKEKIKFLGKIDKKEKTGHSLILDSADRTRTILAYKGVSNYMEFSEIPKFKTKWLYFTGVLGKSFSSQVQLAKKMVANGAKLAFNPGYINSSNDLRELLRLTYVLILNKEEAEELKKKLEAAGAKVELK